MCKSYDNCSKEVDNDCIYCNARIIGFREDLLADKNVNSINNIKWFSFLLDVSIYLICMNILVSAITDIDADNRLLALFDLLTPLQFSQVFDMVDD